MFVRIFLKLKYYLFNYTHKINVIVTIVGNKNGSSEVVFLTVFTPMNNK